MVLTLKAQDAMTKRFKVVSADTTLHDAIKHLEGETDVLFVKDRSRYEGAVTERRIIRSGLDRQETKVLKIAVPTPKLEKETPLVECARLMIENDILELPVFQNDEIVGVVTAEKVLEAASGKLFGNEKVKNMMSEDVIVCSPEDSIFKVLNLFREHHISRVPVVRGGKLEGIVSMHDIVQKAIQFDEHPDVLAYIDDKKPLYQLPIENIMSIVVETVKPDSNVREAIRKLISADIGAVVVVNDDDEPVGMLTKRDLLERLVMLQERQKAIRVQISSSIQDIDRNELQRELEQFIDKRQKMLGEGQVYAYFVRAAYRPPEKVRTQCRVRLITSRAKVHVKAEAPSEMQALKECLHRIKARLEEKRGS
ncbi:CBS domain-containing protein [Candidatus Woesearchaeota archaeon]|nr:MAG: CBS domain-containing protein [Candidatus Woesearchaeota archaeon]